MLPKAEKQIKVQHDKSFMFWGTVYQLPKRTDNLLPAHWICCLLQYDATVGTTSLIISPDFCILYDRWNPFLWQQLPKVKVRLIYHYISFITGVSSLWPGGQIWPTELGYPACRICPGYDGESS